jgi:16S rRNA (cytidine1402-2'-O)-methyltransferase
MTPDNKGILYLIPNTLGEIAVELAIPGNVKNIVNSINDYIVEDEKTARRHLKKLGITKSLSEIVLYTLNEHTDINNIHSYLDPLIEGRNMGIISDAGCPAIADPGAAIVAIAHQKSIKVVPLVGPSSILLALIASGFNGQSFQFQGYLPKERNDRIKKIKELEKTAQQKNQTQLFIEAPYRNQHLFEDIIANCGNTTKLCIACDITLPTELIKTKTIGEWKRQIPDINKRPCVFLIGN